MSEHIFAPNGGYCVYYPSNLFRNARSFEKWGIFNNCSPQCQWLALDISISNPYPPPATNTEVNSCFSIY